MQDIVMHVGDNQEGFSILLYFRCDWLFTLRQVNVSFEVM